MRTLGFGVLVAMAMFVLPVNSFEAHPVRMTKDGGPGRRAELDAVAHRLVAPREQFTEVLPAPARAP